MLFFQKFFRVSFFILFFVSASTWATPVTCVWQKTTAGTYNWIDAANWSPSVPTTGDDVVFNAPAAAQTISFTGATTGALNSLVVVGSSSNRYTFNMSGYTLTVSGTNVRMDYLTISSGSAVNITASGYVVIYNTIVSTVPFSIVANNVSKTGGSTPNSTSTGTYTYQALQVQSSAFDGSFTGEARASLFTSNTFNGAFTFSKKDYGTTNSMTVSSGNGHNTFNGEVTYTLQDSKTNGGIQWADQDTYNAKVTFTNSSITGSNNALTINPSSGTTYFKNESYFNSSSPGGINISNGPSCIVAFSKGAGVTADTVNVFFNNSGTGNILVGNSGGVNFSNSRILLGNTTSSGQIRFSSSGATGARPINIWGSSSINAYPSSASAGSGNPWVSSGRVYLDNVFLSDTNFTATASFNLNDNAFIEYRPGCVFKRNIFSNGVHVSLAGTFNKTATFVQSSSGATITYTGLSFNSNTNFICKSSSSTWNLFGISTASTINDNIVNFNTTSAQPRSVIVFDVQGTTSLIIAYYKGLVNFNNVDVVLRRTTPSPTIPGSITVAYNGKVVMDAGTRLFIDQTAQTNSINLGVSTTGLQTLDFYGSIYACGTMSNPNACGQSTTGMPLTNGLKASSVSFGSFVGKTDINFVSAVDADNNTFVLTYANAVFEKNLYLKCQNIGGYGGSFNQLNGVSPSGSTYDGTTTFYLYGNGNGSRVCTGTYTFDGRVTTFINESLNGNTIFLGNNSADIFYFNGDLLFQNTKIGSAPQPAIKLSRNGCTSYIKGDLRYEGDFGTIPFGNSSGGVCYFNGQGFANDATTQDQIVTYSTTSTSNRDILISRLVIDKSVGQLVLTNNVRVLYYSGSAGTLTLKKGLIKTVMNSEASPYATLCLSDNATVNGGGRHSYVNGPFSKVGHNQFKFFIGKYISSTNNKYFPASISAPSNTTVLFTAEFIDDYQPQGTNLDAGLKDAINCQYWNITKTGTSSAVSVTLFWNNALDQICYPINHDLVCVARNTGIGSSPAWTNEGNNVLNDWQPVDSGYVASTTSYTSMGYFALAYRNALVVNTCLTNPTKFKIYNNVEKANLIYTSGVSGSSAGTKTILSSLKNVPGNIVIHPSFSSTVDLNIDRQLVGTPTDTKANNINYTPLFAKIYTTADGSTNVVDHVTIDEDGDNTFLPLLSDVHAISGNTLSFYKEKQSPVTFDLTNNLSDAVTYTVNRYLTTPYVPFQIISSVPAGYSATLKVYKIDNTLIATNTDLTWNGKIDATTFYPEALYRYEVVLTNGTNTKSYKGQLILKHQ